MTKSRSERYAELDLYKGIGIILVVAAASGMLPIGIRKYTESVCFPLFLLAAGALRYRKGFDEDERKVFPDAVRGYMLPYLNISLVYLVIDAVMMMARPGNFNPYTLYGHIWDSVSFLGIGLLWFLPTCFLAVTAYRIFRYYFSFPVMGGILAAVSAALLFILYRASYNGMRSYDFMEIGVKEYSYRIALLFWRGCLGMFFCWIGELMMRVCIRFREKNRILSLCLSVPLIASGILLGSRGGVADYRTVVLPNPFFSLLSSVLLAGGLFLLCAWIGTVRPLDFLGRHALIIFMTFSGFGLLNLAKKAGDAVFALTDNNFAMRAVTAIVFLATELVMILIFRMRIFSFFFGYRSWDAPEEEEEL
ncbi:MAG: hypothetical protein K6E50_10410 [Lachnospiraceae bacterium]|nr:hypothetical protein [Lachnospiraceae bacterium]